MKCLVLFLCLTINDKYGIFLLKQRKTEKLIARKKVQ